MPIDEKYFDDLNKAAEALSDAALDLCSDKLIPDAVSNILVDDCNDDCDCEPDSPGISNLDSLTIPFNDLESIEIEIEESIDKDDKELEEAFECADLIQAAGEAIHQLSEKLTLARETEANLEMLWYNYRIPGRYHQEKLKAFDVLLVQFDPLVREKRFIEAELQGYGGDNSELQAQLDDVNLRIEQAKAGTAYNSFEAIFDSPPLGLGREAVLRNILGTISDGQDFITFPARAAAFSGRCLIIPVPDFSPSDGVSFKTTIQHKFSDPSGILNGRPKTYLSSSLFRNPVIVIPFEGPAFGTLYSSLYGIWDDANKFFTPTERSLTTERSQADPESEFTKVDNLYIKDINKYYDFMSNYPKKVYDKADIIKQDIIEPALENVSPNAEQIAVKEVTAVLAYGAADESIMDDNGDLKSAVEASREASNNFLAKLNELSADLNFVKLRVTQYQQALDKAIQELKDSPCVKRGDTSDAPDEFEAGEDPIGLKSLASTNIFYPNPTKFCYWRRFAKIASMVNVLPLPGQGGLKYWPIGIVIPTPAGVAKISLPIVWIPLTVVALKAGIMVVFIAQCGISPGPIVFMLGSDGKKKFIISPRPGQIFGASAASSTIKTVEDFGLAQKVKIDKFIGEIGIPGFEATPLTKRSAAIDDIKKKIMDYVGKLEFPTVNINTPGFSFSDYATNIIDKLKVPDITVPRDHKKANPKPTQSKEILIQLRTLSKQGLPAIKLNGGNISIRDVLLQQIDKTALEGIQPPDWPGNEGDVDAAVDKFLAWHKKIIDSAAGKITPELLGLFSVIPGGLTILNPYKCRQDTEGFEIPTPPGIISITVAAVIAALQPMPKDQVIRLLGSAPLTPNAVGAVGVNMLKNSIRFIPPFNIPDPANVSIRSQMQDSVKKLLAFQKQQKPDPSRPPLRLVVIPGEAVEGSIKAAVKNVAKSFQIPAGSTSADLKIALINMVSGTLDQVDPIANPIINTIETIANFSPGSLLEKFGISLTEPGEEVPYVTQPILEQSMKLLAALPAAAYAAVATAPGAFAKLHPLLPQDDIPPWERLTAKNFLFIVFLDLWCKEGKKVGGLFENP